MLKLYVTGTTMLHTAAGFDQQTLRDAWRAGDYRLVWYVVAAIVLFALAGAILLGAIIYCDLKGKHFGAVRQADPWHYQVGCW